MGLLRGSMLKTVVTTLGLVLAACSVGSVGGGGGDTDGGNTGDPRSGTFSTEVLPLIMNKGCLDASCHGGVQTPQMMSFGSMTSNTVLAAKYLKQPSSDNIIITKDVISGTPGMHQLRPYLDATDKSAISAWIDTGP